MMDAATNVFAVIGNPVAHSLSPAMHNAAFAHAGYNGAYHAFRVTDVGAAVAGMRAFGFRGMSVTLPHKVTILRHLDRLDPMAEKIGAVNTVVNDAGRLAGYNSDAPGALKALRSRTEIRGKTAAILGAGGAARAVGFGIVSEGGRVLVLCRNRKSGETLARDLDGDYLPVSDASRVASPILINATPVGMTPDTSSTPFPKIGFVPGMIVMDIVYAPLRTRFLREAEEAGCAVIDGMRMFIHQGACQFELWTGLPAPLEVMEKAVRERLDEINKGEP
jgi:shikimate dehydrogenase